MNNILSLAFLFAIIGFAVYVVMIFNGLVAVKNDVAKAWANIDILLKQRHDELPNLVEVCKGYMNHERETLESVTQARSQYQQAVSVDQKAQADQGTTLALRSLFAVAENYPQLQASQEFTQLQTSLSATEDAIQNARRYYNAVVRDLNTKIQSFPTNILAGMFGFQQRQFFEADAADREPVAVKF